MPAMSLEAHGCKPLHGQSIWWVAPGIEVQPVKAHAANDSIVADKVGKSV